METPITANQLTGRAIGATFFSCFGAIWIALALYIRQTLTIDLAVAVCAGLAALLLAAFWLFRQARRFPKLPENAAMNRAFHRINAAQWIAVGIVCFIFARLHIEVYSVSAITTIVGIHLFPLAKLFRYPLHNLTGAALVLWGSATMLFVPVATLQSTTAVGTGLILWTSAAVTIAIAAIRRTNPSPSPNETSLCA